MLDFNLSAFSFYKYRILVFLKIPVDMRNRETILSGFKLPGTRIEILIWTEYVDFKLYTFTYCVTFSIVEGSIKTGFLSVSFRYRFMRAKEGFCGDLVILRHYRRSWICGRATWNPTPPCADSTRYLEQF